MGAPSLAGGGGGGECIFGITAVDGEDQISFAALISRIPSVCVCSLERLTRPQTLPREETSFG